MVGFDNINNYYDTNLKYSRLNNLERYDKFAFVKGDLTNRQLLHDLFKEYSPAIVINLAAQAGVRFSIKHPEAYVDSNVTGFFNVLEECRHNKIEHLLYVRKQKNTSEKRHKKGLQLEKYVVNYCCAYNH